MTDAASKDWSATAEETQAHRGFWSLIATQFQGAFSDNALKNLILFLILATNLTLDQKEQLVPLVGALFALPFLLFSMAGGYLADRYSKRSVTIGTKMLEIAVMLVALAGLWRQSLTLQLIAIFLLSSQAALFGPSKYGLLPELLPEERLSWGNGIIELGTFLAIIAGTVAGGFLSSQFAGEQKWSGALLLAVSCIGLITSLGIGQVPAANPVRRFRWNVPAEVWDEMRQVRRDQALYLAVLGNTYFYFLTALLISNIPIYAQEVLHASGTGGSIPLAAAAIGIGLGSLAAGYLSSNKIEYGLIPLGSLGMTLFGTALFIQPISYSAFCLLLALLGLFAGLFIVPINAMIQHRPDPARKGAVIATANLLSFVGVFVAAGVYWMVTARLQWHGHMLLNLHLAPAQVFLAGGIFSLLATLYVVHLLPQAFMRLLFIFATHTIYRIRVVGRENIPARGGALFVCNHLSFVDALLLAASTERNIRFILFQDIYETPFIKPLADLMKAIPISSNLRPREMIRSLRAASDAIREGRVVCIFAEGEITRLGRMLPFRRGMERIMKDLDAPIIPVHLDGVWGSIFSFQRGRFFWKLPRRIPYPVTVSFGQAMPASATAMEVRQAVQELETAAFLRQKQRMEPLHRTFLRSARKHPRGFFMADGITPKITFGSALVKTIFLARRLRPLWGNQKMVGLLLPPSVGGALVNYAASLTGRVPVNLNYTASNPVIRSCAEQCSLRTIITSRAFLERLPSLEVPAQAVLLEELAKAPRLSEKLTAFLLAYFCPRQILERLLGSGETRLDDLATIIFSSGSTGDPKGVMLSHYNIASNLDQIGRTFALDDHDRIMGILPFFHSFGFTATLWLPASLGMGVVFHPSPLDTASIGALVRNYAVTFLVATPTFLQAYIRRCQPQDFGSLQYVIVGAEKLPERVAQAFENTFGIRPLEGYGCTECSPVVAVNSRDFRAAGFRQIGAKRGRIGHPLPGISIRIVEPDTGRPLPLGQPGLMLVKGPNVMMGYLGRPEKTAEVLSDGWYNTGDIAVMDEDGFLTITDRLSRFSKIGGEMVPHIKVEESLHVCAESVEQVFAVAGVPDGKKGERLVVLHTLTNDKLSQVLERFAASDLPPLWKPKPAQFFRIDAIPYMGTGKLDLRRIREIATEKSPSEADSAGA